MDKKRDVSQYFLFSECCSECNRRCEEEEKLCCPVCHASADAVKQEQGCNTWWVAMSSLFGGAALVGGFLSGWFLH